MRPRIRTALAVGAISAALALAGCSGGDSREEAEESPKETTTASQGAEGSTEGTSASAEPSATIPEGYQEVTVTVSGTEVSLAVPQDWADLKALSDEEIQAAAQANGSDPAALQQQIDAVGLFYQATEADENNLAESVTAEAGLLSATGTPTEADVADLLSEQGIQLEEYGTVETPNGEAATGTYTSPQNEAAKAEVIIAPTSTDGSYAVLYVTTSSAERTAELVRDVAGSIH